MAGRNTVEILLSAQDRASGTIRGAFGTLEQANNRALGALKVGAAAAMTAMSALSGIIAKVGIEYNATAESSAVAWNTLLGSQEKAKKMLEDIAQFAKTTQFDSESVDIMAKYMNNAGFAGKELFKQLTKVADVAGAFNIPAESAKELARQMSQVQQAGLAYTEDLNILQDRGVPIYKAIAKELGITVAGVKKLASDGKLTADIYNKAFDSIAKSVEGASEKQSQTFNGMISTLKDNLNMIAGELSKPLFEKLKVGLDAVMPLLDKFLTGLKDGGAQGALAAILPESAMNVIGRFSEGIQGILAVLEGNKGGGISMLSRTGLTPEAINLVVGGVDKIRNAMGILKGAFSILTGDSIGGITFLTKLGLSPETITKVVEVVNGIKTAIKDFVSAYVGYVKGLFSGDGNLGESFGKIFNTAKSIVMPILSEIIGFIKEKLGMIKQFWDENGAQIIQAIKNVWNIIASIFEFIAPVILAILKMLWDSVAGLIDGVLKVIMGLIKVFAGLFTGDFGKMWEGIKQIFFGAIEAVWNWINLLMFGRILGGIKGFITKGAEGFTAFWTKTVEIFKNLDTHLWNIITGIASKIGGVLKGFVDEGIRIFGTLKSFGSSIFESLWAAVKTVAMNMASGVKNFFLDMFTGAKFHMEGILNKAKTIFDAVKNAITNPIDTAKTLIGKAIDKIKEMFSGISKGLKIPLPHFDVKMGTKKIMGKEIPWPDLDISWYDKGGVFYGPQIIGVGEKRPEFVGALDDLRQIVREETAASKPVSQVPQYAIINIDGRQAMLAMIDYIEEEQELRDRRWK